MENFKPQSTAEIIITPEMQQEAEILKINLDKLKDKIESVGGVDKFKELADGHVNSEVEGLSGATDGEKVVVRLVKKLYDLQETIQNKVGIASGVVLAAVMPVLQQVFNESSPDSPAESTVYYGLVATGTLLALYNLGSLAYKNIKAPQVFKDIKEKEMTLEMVGAETKNIKYGIENNPASWKLSEKIDKMNETDKQKKIDDIL